MPTVCREKGYRVVIYPADHRPAHVHVIKSGCEAVFNLQCPGGPPELRENHGFALRELNQVKTILAQGLTALCKQWSLIHGNYR